MYFVLTRLTIIYGLVIDYVPHIIQSVVHGNSRSHVVSLREESGSAVATTEY